MRPIWIGRRLLRRWVVAALHAIPLRLLLAVRNAYFAAPPTSRRRRALQLGLEVIRYRGVPRDCASFSLPDDASMQLLRADSYILERLYWLGEQGYEPEVMYWWRHCCRRSSSILELGANVGYFTVGGALSALGKYVAVEPHPGCADLLRRNLSLNHLQNVTVLEAAVVSGPSDGPTHLVLARGCRNYVDAPCGGFLEGGERTRIQRVAYESISVPGVSIGALMKGVDLLKLDVEGLEAEILSGAPLDSSPLQPTIFLELLDDTPRLRALVVELCQKSDYSCYVPQVGTLVLLPVERIPSASLPREFGTRDLILSRDPRLAESVSAG